MKNNKITLPLLFSVFGFLAIFVIINFTEAIGNKNSKSSPEKINYPPTRVVDQADTYHGVSVSDPYRWLEETETAESRKWISEQDKLMTGFARKWSGHAALQRRIVEIRSFERFGRPTVANGVRFFTVTLPGQTSGVLYAQKSEDGEPELLLDVKKHFKNEDVKLRNFTPSPDGKLVAYEIGEGQSLWRELRIWDVKKEKDLEDSLTGLHSWGSWINWTKDSQGFYYRKFDKTKSLEGQDEKLQNASIRFHRLGTEQSQDELIYTRTDKSNWLFTANLTLDENYLVIGEYIGGNSKNTVVFKDLSKPNSDFIKLFPEADALYNFIGSKGSKLWFLTDLQAPNRRIIQVDVSYLSDMQLKEIVPEQKQPLQSVSVAGDYFLTRNVNDAKPMLKLYSQEGKFIQTIKLPDIGGPGGIGGRQTAENELFYSFSSLYDPGTVYCLDLTSGKSEQVYRADLAFSPEDYVTKQVFYKSKDGTRVPMFISHKRGLDITGEQPLFMYGYGAWGWSAFPWFQPHILAWMELGGIYALPGIRGGGEYGESWHEAGIKLNKQNGIDDFIAAAEWLVENGYTSKSKIVANGGSASGLLAGAAIVQRPDLFGGGVIDIPSLDLIRFVESPGGQYLTPEYGAPSDPEEFKVLRSISPYHNLKDGVCYPPTLVMVGERDQTAIPMHGYKFIARMQAVQNCSNPALLKVMWGAGHNYGTTTEQSAESWADAIAFLFRTLQVET